MAKNDKGQNPDDTSEQEELTPEEIAKIEHEAWLWHSPDDLGNNDYN